MEVKRKVNRNANFNTIHPDRITPDWNEQTPDRKRREQMAQLNPEIVLRMMAVRKLIIFRHEKELGNAPAWKLFERVHVARKADVTVPRSFADYEWTVEDENLPEGVTCEVKG